MSKQIIHKILSHGAQSGAVSLVISHSDQGLIFNYKFKDGHEQNFSLPGRLGQKALESLRQILKISENDLNPKKNFKLKEKNYQLNFKLNIIPEKDGDKIIISIINKDNKPWRLRQLGFSRENLKTLQKMNKLGSGLIIISSPENQGKSTTLRALLKELDLETKNAYFLEKNPKQLIKGMNYLIPNKNNWENILRHDCDIIVIDDLHDAKDWVRAIKAADTGRLVIAATSAQSSLEIILKILKLELPPLLKINCLKMMVNQRLVNLTRKNKIKKPESSLKDRTQIAVSEIIIFNQKIKKYLIENGADQQKEKFWKKLNDLITENGFKPLNQDLAGKIKTGSVKKQNL